jgi:hypothetical protein
VLFHVMRESASMQISVSVTAPNTMVTGKLHSLHQQYSRGSTSALIRVEGKLGMHSWR